MINGKTDAENPQFLILTDEDGTEAELEVLAELEYEGENYVVLYPTADAPGKPVVIMRRDDDEFFFVGDQDIIDGVYAEFQKLV